MKAALQYSNLSSTLDGNNFLIFQTGLTKKFNDRLLQRVVEHTPQLPPSLIKASNDSTYKNEINFTTWNKTNLFRLNLPEVLKLRELLTACIETFTSEFQNQYRHHIPNYVTCWTNILKNYDGKTPPHRHHSNPFNAVGVYYASGEFSEGNGSVRFWIKNQTSYVVKEISPTAGTLILFPATLFHSLAPYVGRTPRVSYGFDIRFRKGDFGEHPCCLLNPKASPLREYRKIRNQEETV